MPGFLERQIEAVEGLDVDLAADAMASALNEFVMDRWPKIGTSRPSHMENIA